MHVFEERRKPEPNNWLMICSTVERQTADKKAYYFQLKLQRKYTLI